MLTGRDGDRLHVIDETNEDGGDLDSPKKQNKSFGINTSKITTAGGPLTPEEIEILRKENMELMEQIKRYKEAGLVPVNKTGCCSIF